jgi:hypothetical protein
MAWLVLALILVPGPVLAQVRGPDPDRRTELEEQVRRQFLAQVSQRLGLTDDQRDEVRGILAGSVEARRDLALESQALRIELMQAVREEDAPMSRFETILEQLDALRTREQAIQEQEEAALAEVLDPRQQAMFLFLRMQLNDRVRQMRGPMRGAGPGGGSPFI